MPAKQRKRIPTPEEFEEALIPAFILTMTAFSIWAWTQYVQIMAARYDFIPVCPGIPCP